MYTDTNDTDKANLRGVCFVRNGSIVERSIWPSSASSSQTFSIVSLVFIDNDRVAYSVRIHDEKPIFCTNASFFP